MHIPFSFLAVLATPLLSTALPVRREAAAPVDNSANLLVLKFAHVLEQLETQFYTEALAKFQPSDFINAGFISADVPVQQFQAIQSHEQTHTTALEAAIVSLGDKPLSGCNFDFTSVLTDVATMAPVARLVENVGVGAYLGAARLITDEVILTAAASILTDEARHQTVLNILNGGSAIPQAFDIPLLPQEVLAIAGGFISGCDTGIPSNPALAVTNSGPIVPGTSLTFSATTIDSSVDPSTLSCQMLAGGMPFSLTLPFSACVVPPNINGPVAIWVTNNTQPLANNVRDRFSGNIVAGPTMAFLDIMPEALGGLAHSGSTVSTATISPAEATSIAAGASSTVSGSAAEPTPTSSESTPPVSNAAENNVGAPPPGGPNLSTGPSADGSVTVLGWQNIPE